MHLNDSQDPVSFKPSAKRTGEASSMMPIQDEADVGVLVSVLGDPHR